MVSTRPPTSKSSSPFSNPLVTVPNTPITIGIIVTSTFHSFFLIPWQGRGIYPSFHILSVLFCCQPGQQSRLFCTFSFFFFFFCWLLLSLVFWPGLGDLSFSSFIIILLHEIFSYQRLLMVFHRSLNDSKSSQVSRTLQSILADLNNAVVWTVSTRLLMYFQVPVLILSWLYQELPSQFWGCRIHRLLLCRGVRPPA